MQVISLWRENWGLIVVSGILLLFLVGGIWRAVVEREEPEAAVGEAQSAPRAQRLVTPHRETDQARLRAILEREPGPQRPDQATRTQEIIASHQASFDADPDSPDAPAYLRAMANLQMQRLRDYEAAALNYEMIIMNYPDWDQTRGVFGELMTCYEMLDDVSSIIRLSELMLERYPEGSEEYYFALGMIGLYDPEQVVEHAEAQDLEETESVPEAPVVSETAP